MTNNDLQNTTQKTKDRATQTQQTTVVNSGAPEGQAVGVPEGQAVAVPLRRRLCCSSYKPGHKSCIRRELGSTRDKWNIVVVICDIDIP